MIDVVFDKSIVTKVRPEALLGEEFIEHFALKMYRNFIQNKKASSQEALGLPGKYPISPIRNLTLDKNGFLFIPFLRKAEEFPSISLKDVLEGKYPKDFFRDSLVIVGEYGTLIHDAHFAPVSF